MTRSIAISASVLCAIVVLQTDPNFAAAGDNDQPKIGEHRIVTRGRLAIDFDPAVLDALQWQFVAHKAERTEEAFPEENRTVSFVASLITCQAVAIVLLSNTTNPVPIDPKPSPSFVTHTTDSMEFR